MSDQGLVVMLGGPFSASAPRESQAVRLPPRLLHGCLRANSRGFGVIACGQIKRTAPEPRRGGDQEAGVKRRPDLPPVALSRHVSRSVPRRLRTLRFNSVELRCADCTDARQNPCDGWPLHAGKAGPGTGSDENRCNLHSAARRDRLQGAPASLKASAPETEPGIATGGWPRGA